MAEEIWIIIAMLLFYPLMVLWIAITGPHNETEKRERLESRLSPHNERIR